MSNQIIIKSWQNQTNGTSQVQVIYLKLIENILFSLYFISVLTCGWRLDILYP